MQLESVLEQYYGYSSFRPGQKAIIETILEGKDTLAILPTGGGKSICYQLPALILDGMTVVVSPLISLMKDQVDTLKQQGIAAAYLNSTISESDFRDVIQAIRRHDLKLLYVAPERLENQQFIQFLSGQTISLVAVDEAHCVSQWGFDFRPSYRNIIEFVHQLPRRPRLAAFTATATTRVQDDISKQLQFNDPQVFLNSFDRPNIKFTVLEPTDRRSALYQNLSHDEAIIIYANTRKQVDQLYETLKQANYAVGRYHAGLNHDQRQQAQNDFINDAINIIVATNAFGMGIDKTDVRKVIHYNLPKDLEGYYQEAGRAGRDSLAAEAILLYQAQDIMTNKYIIAQSQDSMSEQRLETAIQYASYTGCLRNFILHYFGEEATAPCGNCSTCLNEVKMNDVTREAQMVLSSIMRMKFPYGATMIIDVLRGSANQKVLANGFDKLSTYGLMKRYAVQDIRDIISTLVAHRYVGVNEHRGLFVTKAATDLLKGKARLTVKERQRNRPVSSQLSPVTTNKGNRASGKTVDSDLFEQLRAKRFELAQEEKVPAYIIFSNKALEDMAVRRPRDYQSFLQVEGVGTVKAEKYAGAFLAVIDDYLKKAVDTQVSVPDTIIEANHDMIESSHIVQTSYKVSVDYANQGLTPHEIGIERGLSEATILGHLFQGAQEGLVEAFEADLAASVKSHIKQAINQQGTESLKALKEVLPTNIRYEDIRYVLLEMMVKD